MTMYYKKKSKYKIELTEAQVLWLYRLLGLGMDGYFEGNPRERKLCDNVCKKVEDSLEMEYKRNYKKKLNLRKDRMTGSKAQTPGTDAGRTPLEEKGEK